ncbi:glycosyltransferase [Brachybacterium squillarum]|uniref:glycosyltransferase n=1 Tax=Brachybacterium squillarum TaxID=661979 RepID=UPI000A0248A2|nr:glycosyltransferase [Brachybacterium squillarum]
MRAIVLAVHQLGSGGVTNAVLDQAQMFTGAGYETWIATLDDSPAMTEHAEQLRRRGRLPAGVKLANPHLEARGTPADETPAGTRRSGPEDSEQLLAETGDDRHGRYRRLFTPGGEYRSFERLRSDGSIKHVNHFENRVLVRRDHIHNDAVHKSTYFTVDGRENREAFFAPSGFCYVQRWIDPASGKGAGVYASERGSGTVTRFPGMPDWHVAWLQTFVDRFETPPIVISQTASVIPKMIRLRRASAVRIAMMHNSQVATPFSIDSPLRSDYNGTFSQLEELDAFAILSEAQRVDMARRLGSPEVFTVVPNALHQTSEVPVRRDPNLVSIVSRLAPQKAIHEAIHAFARVHRKLPHARLEIYGDGAVKGDLQETIETLGLSGIVRLMGRTDSPREVMARSVCTLSTSEWEALPLSIAESLVVRTPVVAYDCLYGPSTLILDGRTGYLVPRHGREELARAVISLLKNPRLAAAMGDAGREDITSRLSFPAVLGAWRATFEHAERRAGLS